MAKQKVKTHKEEIGAKQKNKNFKPKPKSMIEF